jgi:hypothetical protein
MNLVLISCGLNDPDAWRLALNIDKVIHIDTTDTLIGMRDASIALDEYIYFDRNKVDFVLYMNNESGICKWAEFQIAKDYVDKKSDTVYFTQTKKLYQKNIPDVTGIFYCRPHVFTFMGSLWKLNMDNDIGHESRAGALETRVIYGLSKAGYNISSL